MEKRIRPGKVLNFAGAMVAYLIGSGFASGQESLQFFTAYGPWGCLGAGIIVLALYLWFSTTIMSDGHRLQLDQTHKVYHYYCGKYIGTFFEYFTPAFLYMVFIVMISGAGATINEYYGLHPLVGRFIMAGLSLITVLCGLKGAVNIVGKVGPFIILFSLIVGIGTIIRNPAGISQATELLKNIEVMKAAPNWAISAVVYALMGCVLAVPFLSSVGAEAASDGEARASGALGAVMFTSACITMAYGIMAKLGDVYTKNVPTLFLADELSHVLGAIFSVVLIAAMYSTAAPMLLMSCSRIAEDEKSKKFRLIAVGLTIVGLIASLFPFSTLVNMIYPFTGYLGIILFACIFIKTIKTRKELRREKDTGHGIEISG